MGSLSLLLLASLIFNYSNAWIVSPTQLRPNARGSNRRHVSIQSDSTGSSNNSDRDHVEQSDNSAISESINNGSTVSWNWRAVVETAFASDKRPIILFDGVCLFCNAGVDLCLNLDKKEKFRFASLQSKVGQSLLLQHNKAPNDLSSIVLVESQDKAYFESDAILRIAKELQGLPGLVRMASKISLSIVPTPLRNAAYHVVANNRYMFGHTEECRLDLDGVLARRFVEDPTEDEEMLKEASASAAAL